MQSGTAGCPWPIALLSDIPLRRLDLVKCALASSIVTIYIYFKNVAFFTQSEDDLSLMASSIVTV